MQIILRAILDTLKELGNWAIIWIVGPDGTIFDIKSILKIIGSTIAALWLLIKVMWNFSRKM